MPAPKLGRSDRKRQAIMAAASSLFLSRGYDGTSMDDVAALAEVSKPTVYNHFADKERLFHAIVLATTDEMDDLVRLVGDALAETRDLERDLTAFARRFLAALMQPRVLRLRRLVIANADRFPAMGRAWYERGFERALATLAAQFQQLADARLLEVDDALMAANHFVSLLLWIPVNRVMFTGDERDSSDADLDTYAVAAVHTFLNAYARRSPAASK